MSAVTIIALTIGALLLIVGVTSLSRGPKRDRRGNGGDGGDGQPHWGDGDSGGDSGGDGGSD